MSFTLSLFASSNSRFTSFNRSFKWFNSVLRLLFSCLWLETDLPKKNPQITYVDITKIRLGYFSFFFLNSYAISALLNSLCAASNFMRASSLSLSASQALLLSSSLVDPSLLVWTNPSRYNYNYERREYFTWTRNEFLSAKVQRYGRRGGGVWLYIMAYFHCRRRIWIPNPIVTLYYAEIFPLVWLWIWIAIQMVSQMVTVPILGMDLHPRDRSPSLFHTFESGDQSPNPNQWKNPA